MIKNKPLFSDTELNTEIERNAKQKTISSGSVLIKQGDKIVFIPIVIKGSIRVIRQEENGQEVFLYHLYPGQTCAMSLTCCQSRKKSMIKAIAEDDTELIQIPIQLTED